MPAPVKTAINCRIPQPRAYRNGSRLEDLFPEGYVLVMDSAKTARAASGRGHSESLG